MNAPPTNIAGSLKERAAEIPESPAIIVPKDGKRISFMELERESDRLGSGLGKLGIQPGDRVLLMVPFGIDFIALTFALFKMGAVCVLIDPGLGRKNVLKCIEEAEPQGMVVVPLVHAARKFFPRPFAGIRIAVTAGCRWFWGGHTLDEVRKSGSDSFHPAVTGPDDPAAILFTSGSTGPPKGVLYTHGMFYRQMNVLRECYGIGKGEVDLPTFPLFGLFGAAMGMTCVIPEMDFTRPAKVDPENIIRAVTEFDVTNSFGSPALWNTVTRHCAERNVRLPSLKRILIAGAPVPGSLLKRFENIVDPGCRVHTPYGATEALPVTTVDRDEVLGETWERSQKGQGTCVGRPLPGMELKIIKITDDPVPFWDNNLELPPGETGEIAVRGPWVTRLYHNRNTETRLAKITDGDSFWHRMGDVGKIDGQGRLWFMGRKSHRVVTGQGTLFTIPCEAVFNTHPDVRRSALVGIGRRGEQEPAIVIEPENGKRISSDKEKEAFRKELLKRGSGFDHTRGIQKILFHPDFPVDVRHNAKIFRERLADWAGTQ